VYRRTTKGARLHATKRVCVLAIAAPLAGLVAASGHAAALDDIGRRLPADRATERTTPLPRLAPPTLAAEEKQPFILTAVTLRGATVFKPQDIAPLYERYLTRFVDVSDIAKIAEAITEKYRSAGYFLSRAIVPAQDTASGLLVVDVIEGYINDVRLEGDDMLRVRERAQALLNSRPLRLADLDRTLSLIGDMNGVSITQSRIEPNPTDMSLHRLVLSIENRMVQASLYADNRGTESAGRLQTYARARLNSVLQEGDQFAMGFFTNPSPFKNLMYGEWSYTALMGSSGTQLTASAGVTTSDAAANLFGLQTDGEVKRVSLRLSHPFIRSRDFSLWGNLGLDARNLHGEQFGVTVYDERLRLLSGSLSLRHDGGNGTTNLYTEVTGGLGGLGASDGGDALLSRADAHPQFLKAELLLSRYQNIGRTFGVYVAVAGQISADPLPASEEFAVGGAEFGRAYDYWAISGDHGASGQVELRHGRNPGLPLIKFYQLYGYYDIGWVWNRNAAAGFGERSLESAGVGLRLTLPGSLYLTYESAWPLSQTPSVPLDYAWRNYFSVSANF
jgi:hemolysin activation/secretion protein